MVGLDTNVLVRYLVQDDPRQSAIATRLIDHELSPAQPGYISLLVLAEVCWVLKRLYTVTELELMSAVEDLLMAAQFHIERRDTVLAAVQMLKHHKSAKAGLVDALIAQIAKADGCSRTVTFDKGAVRFAGMALLA